MILQQQQNLGYEAATAPSSRRLLGLGAAILFHALLLYGLTSGLGREVLQKVQKTVNVAIIEEPKPPPPPPPPEDTPPPKASPRAVRPKAYVPEVETRVKPSPESDRAITSTSDSTADVTSPIQTAVAAVAPAAPPTPPKPKVVSPRLMAGCALPRYPQRSLENAEEGLVVFQFLVGLDGVVKEAVLVQSSGHARLDEAAKLAFQKCKFTPGSINGAPAQTWVRQPFRWRLQ